MFRVRRFCTTRLRVFAGRLPKWFGERPGKKANDPETPEEEELKKNEEDELEPFGIDDEEAEEEVNTLELAPASSGTFWLCGFDGGSNRPETGGCRYIPILDGKPSRKS